MKFIQRLFPCLLVGFFAIQTKAQITERERPVEWKNLILGGRFMDRFLPMVPIGPLTSDTWGANSVRPRYIENGIEDDEWSYWGGNSILGDDGRYHLFVCRWREDSLKGHGEWPNSKVVRTVSDKAGGPYKVVETIGAGHNPEIFRADNGQYVLYVIDGRYVSDSIDGPWAFGTFEFDARDRPIIEGLSNLSFAHREDGSYIMVCRGGGIWFSKDGLSPYYQVTDKSVYPPVEGRYEDPIIWRTNIQYHMIVNDWLGRIAYYLRSKDGIHWKVDPGEAYLPGITKYTDGTEEDWFKYERIKVIQDSLGRATHAHFAVIDVLKKEDKGNDNHSSKHIVIPLTVGRQISLPDRHKIDANTETIRVKIKAEPGFDPHTDIDLGSLRFGASEEVNFGRGSLLRDTSKEGADLILIFEAKGNGLTDANFTGKLLGKTKEGRLLFGYARLPWLDYLEPALSVRLPEFRKSTNTLEVEIRNFGEVASTPTTCSIEMLGGTEFKEVASGTVPKLQPFGTSNIGLPIKSKVKLSGEKQVKVTLYPENQEPVVFMGKIKFD